MYRYDTIDEAMLADPHRRVRGQVGRRLAGELTGPVQAAAACQRSLSAAPRLHAADRGALWLAGSDPAAQARLDRAPSRQGLRPLRPVTNLQFHWIKLADAPDHHGLTTWPASTCTPSRPPETASATSRLIPMRARRLRRSTIHACGPRRSANGRPSTRNSTGCRASSRSRSPPPPRTGTARPSTHDIGLNLKRASATALASSR